MPTSQTLWLIPGDQLFDPLHAPLPPGPKLQVFMAEDFDLCTHFAYHKKKLVFFLTAMRRHASLLREKEYQVHYETLPDRPETPENSYKARLSRFIREKKVTRLVCHEIEDRFFETEILELCKELNVTLDISPSPMFLTSREEFKTYLKSQKKPFMKTFYERQRKRLKILVEKDGTPTGGRWSFDEENRKKLPKDYHSRPLPQIRLSPVQQEVENLVTSRFRSHPGDAQNLWVPTSHTEARAFFKDFLQYRFHEFGAYEDAFSSEQEFLNHSALTPLLNSGLLTPREVIDAALAHARKNDIPIESLEGFIRQVIGWREFVRGIYRNYDDRQQSTNFWNHHRSLKPCWWEGTTGIPPLDETIRKAVRLGYTHHIERLMIAGNLMLLSQVNPTEAHRWFMELYIDSADWVMGPNVYGMALHSDGGIFATKPYICGSNYWLKMGHLKKGEWCDTVDGLYWSFIERNRSFFQSNPRLSMMVRTLDKIPPQRRELLFKKAKEFVDRTTTDG